MHTLSLRKHHQHCFVNITLHCTAPHIVDDADMSNHRPKLMLIIISQVYKLTSSLLSSILLCDLYLQNYTSTTQLYNLHYTTHLWAVDCFVTCCDFFADFCCFFLPVEPPTWQPPLGVEV